MQDNHTALPDKISKFIYLLNKTAELSAVAGNTVAILNYGYGLIGKENIKLIDSVSAKSDIGLSNDAKMIIKEWMKQITAEDQRAATDFIVAIEEGGLSDVISLFTNDTSLRSLVLDYFTQNRYGLWLEQVLPPDFDRPHSSHLGGIPSLQSHLDWPYDHDGRRAFFVGQLDCEEISRILPGYLPEAGILCFFMDQDIEGGWNEDGTRKCYVVHVPGSGGCLINSVPDDYPRFGTWMSAIADISLSFASPEGGEFQPRVWPRQDLKPQGTSKNPALRQAQCERGHINHRVPFVVSLSNHVFRGAPHKVATFADTEYVGDDEVKKFCTSLIYDIKSRYLDQKRDAILGPKRDEERISLLFPNTVPTYFYQYKEKSFSSYAPGYPWSRYHIVRALQEALASVRKEFHDLKSHRLKDLNKILELDRRYCTKYAWGYGEVKKVPDYLTDSPDIEFALNSVRSHGDPCLLEGFLYWLELEEFYKEGSTRLDALVGDPFSEPTDREKDEFITWVAGWVNHGCARRDERMRGVIVEKGYPIRVTQWEHVHNARRSENNRDFYWYFADRLQWACHGALERSNILCASHSGEMCRRLHKSIVDDLSQRYKSRYAFHKCLGFGDRVQHAAYQHRDKVLLLEVRSDSALFTNFGDGALQFWIDREDLAAMRFDEAFMTGECT